MTDLPRLSLAIPPSLGSARSNEVAERLQTLLRRGGLTDIGVYTTPSYGALSLELMTERADLAWAPPSVCARAEVMGGYALVQSVRAGSRSYRSALVMRRGEDLDLGNLGETKAVWVDPDSTGGYLLPRAWFWSRGIDVRSAFADSSFVGSYSAALQSILAGNGDVTAVYATVSGAAKTRSALADIPGLEDRLEIIAYTEEAPGDGVACRASLPSMVRDEVQLRLLGLCDDADRADEFRALFGADKLVAAGRDAYQALHDIVKLDDDKKGSVL